MRREYSFGITIFVMRKIRNDKITAFRLPTELLERIRAAAERENLTVTEFFRRAMARDLEARESVFQKSLRAIGGKR